MIRIIFCLIFLEFNLCKIEIANLECTGQLKPIGDTSCNDFLQPTFLRPPINFQFTGVINKPLINSKPTTTQSSSSKSSTSRTTTARLESITEAAVTEGM